MLLRLSTATRNLVRYGFGLIFILLMTFLFGLFLLFRSVHKFYVDSYLDWMHDHYTTLLTETVQHGYFEPGLIVRKLDENLADKQTKVDYSHLVTTKSLPALVGGFSGIFSKTNSAKFILPEDDGYIFIEVSQEYFTRHAHGRRASTYLVNSDENVIVLSYVPEQVGKKLTKEFGLTQIGGSIGFIELKDLPVSNAKIGLFVPLTTYLYDISPYLLVSFAALIGASTWLAVLLRFEKRLVGSIALVLDSVNKAAAKATKGQETHYVPIKTEVEELSELQNSILRLLETEKATQAEMHSMMDSLQDTVNELEEAKKTLEERNIQIISSLAEAIEIKDVGTRGHSDRMVTLALELARELGITNPADLEAIRFGALLHDVGKIGIPERILNKSGRLTPEEFEVMKMHPVYGERIIKNISGWDLVADVVRHHHENIDGTGYPDRLVGDQISLRAQIVAMVDVFTALIEERPYRRALSIDEALKIIESEMVDKKFHPRVYEAFKRVLERFLREKGLVLFG